MVNAGKVSGAHALRPNPTEADWSMMQDAYRKIKKDTDPNDIDLYKAFDANDNGFKVPIDVKYAAGKGRGVFCKEFIPKGKIVNESRSGFFYTEAQWRGFLTSIPQDWAKDCCDWAYVDHVSNGKPAVWLDFCEAALMNHAALAPPRWKTILCCLTRKPQMEEHVNPDETANLKEKIHKGRWCGFAIRDIQAGEELLCDYEGFHDYTDPLPWYETIWEEYWENSSSSSSSSSSN